MWTRGALEPSRARLWGSERWPSIGPRKVWQERGPLRRSYPERAKPREVCHVCSLHHSVASLAMEEICCYQHGDKPMLYTLPMSHYCEAARWCLAAGGVDFVEAAYLPGVHSHCSPIELLRRKGVPPDDFTGSVHSTPLLVNADKDVLAYDSWQCMEKLGILPTPRAKELLDTVIGPCARTIFYSYALASGSEAIFARLWSSSQIPVMQKVLYSTPLRWSVQASLYSNIVESEEHVQQCRESLRAAIDDFEPFLYEPPFAGKDPTVSGIALASLMAPVVLPPEYAISFYKETLFNLEGLPPAMQDEVETWRRTPVGAWTLEYYKVHRRQCGDISG